MSKQKKKCAIILRLYFFPSRMFTPHRSHYSYSQWSKYILLLYLYTHTGTDCLDVAVIRIYNIRPPNNGYTRLVVVVIVVVVVVLLFIVFLDTAQRSIRTKLKPPRPSIHCSCKLVVRHREQPRYP